jgi:chemotaxis protein MotA
MSVGHHVTDAVFLKRIFVLFGGDFFNGGYIQLLTYIAFLWSLLEIFQMLKDIEIENKAFKKKVLPTEERHLLLPAQINDIYLKASEHAKGKKLLLFDMIKKACLKFRATKSIPEMIEIISIQTEINKEISESDQSNIKYLTWVIPSIGFVGTVLGISQALMIANSGDMNLITATLGVAFDTTLISLILSIIVMWYYHKLTKETDYLHAHLKSYIIENLINRIEID